jgi:hypothetical protein
LGTGYAVLKCVPSELELGIAMNRRERRIDKRYVVGSLLLEAGGVLHETLDVSRRAVAIVQLPDIDYSKCSGPAWFRSEQHSELNQRLARLHFMSKRGGFVVLGYEVAAVGWEAQLAAHDVRSDLVPLEDVFG